jgi:hypothetical protein
MSDSAAGSSEITSNVSPIFILSNADFVLKTGSGQIKPVRSSFLFALEVMDSFFNIRGVEFRKLWFFKTTLLRWRSGLSRLGLRHLQF